MLAADPIITEFLASNSDGLLDGNGISSDWIEIFNAGDTSVDLNGWYLTDDAADLSKWQFPDVDESILDPGEYLVVFASGDSIPDPAGNLHTNFRLSAPGEHVALVNPGLTVVSEFGPAGSDFPEQFADVSYGFQGVATSGPGTILYIDSDEEPGGNTAGLLGGWTPRGAGAGDGSANFGNEGGTLQATGPVDEISTTVTGLNPNLVYDVFAFFWDADNGWNVQAGLTSGNLTNYVTGTPGVFEINALTQQPGTGQQVAGLNVLGQSPDDYSDWVDGNRTLHAAPVGQVSGSSTATVYIDHDSSLTDRTFFDGIGIRSTGTLVDATSPAEYLIPTNGTLGTGWTANGFDAAANGFTSGQAAIGYENNPNGNIDSFAPSILTTMPSGTSSVYLRTQFEIADASAVSNLVLSAQYDDGFVAYLNGTKVLTQLAPATPAWNSTATSPTGRTDADSLQYEEFSLAAFVGELEDGTNTLAIHALNTSSGSTDFLFSPQLTLSTGTVTFDEVRYLTTPTPGTANSTGVEGFVGDTKFNFDRGFYDAPINVEITSSTIDADIYYSLDGTEPGPGNASSTLYTGAIVVDQTTSLRAAAFKDGFEPTDVDTQTYVFLEDVVQQDPLDVNGGGVSPDNGLIYPTTFQQGFTPQYDLDPEIVTASEYDDSNGLNTDIGIRESLLALPTISLTLPHDQFFGPLSGPTVGIATNATQRVEHSGSIEYFDPNTGLDFQFNAEIEAHGNSSRNNSSTPKHSFRVTFNRTGGGPAKLNIPIFENSDNDDINAVVIRGIFTEAFAARNRNNITNRFNPLYSTYIRDAFLRDTQIDTGALSPASSYAHLYINGLYWGLYNPTERIDDKFLESNLGGNAEDYDVVRGFNGELFRGERTAYNELLSTVGAIQSLTSTDLAQANLLYQQLQGNFADGTNDPNLDALLNVDSLIDYLIIQQWSGAGDWPGGNWYAARNRVDPGEGFQFIIWDQELSLDQLFRDRTGTISGNDTPGELYNNLNDLPEFQLRYADRAHALLANDGPLSPAASQARWDKWADLVEPGIVAESARWGDAQQGIVGDVAFSQSGPAGTTPLIPIGQPATVVDPLTIEDWRVNVEYVRNEVLAKSADILLGRLLNRQLFTSVDAPVFSINGSEQFGGAILSGSSLTMSGPGTVYYTLDGSDPRNNSGVAVGTEYTGSTITLDTTTILKARTLSAGNWSALSETIFTTDDTAIVISEVNYNPYAPTTPAELAINGIESDDFEFIELLNTHATDTINLNNFQIADAVDYTFGNVSLAPGERALVVEDQQAFEARYGTSLNVVGEWSGKLSNTDETIQLLNGLGAEIMSLSYADSDPWAVSADGAGATLVLDDPDNTPANQLGKYYSYRGSAEFGGTPGAASVPLAGVVINEVLTHTDLPEIDAIELYNPTGITVDLGGWFLSDSDNDLFKYEIPAGTMIGSGQYLVFDEDDFGFALKSDGDQVYLIEGNGSGGVSAFVDQVDFGGAFNGESFGRVPDATGRLAPQVNTTFGGPNSAPRIGPLVISEVNYHPSAPSPAALLIDPALIDNDLEYVEIHNPTDGAVDLTDWQLRGESDYDFVASTILAAGETVLLVSFDPNSPANSDRHDAFRAHYGIGAEVTLLGGYSGNLGNGFARVELQQPDAPDLGIIPHVTSDEVLYDDLAPWPTTADGGGEALQRAGAGLYGNAATSWYASAPTPGVTNFLPNLPGDYDQNGIVQQNDYAVWRASFGSTTSLDADGNGNGVIDAADYTVWRDNLGASLPATIGSGGSTQAAPEVNTDPSPDGAYSSVLREVEAQFSQPAQLFAISPETLQRQSKPVLQTSEPQLTSGRLTEAWLILADKLSNNDANFAEEVSAILSEEGQGEETDNPTDLTAIDAAFESV